MKDKYKKMIWASYEIELLRRRGTISGALPQTDKTRVDSVKWQREHTHTQKTDIDDLKAKAILPTWGWTFSYTKMESMKKNRERKESVGD